jgi:signal recognition particle subunit SRP54
MFETLSERLTSALGTLTGKGRLSEKDIEAALRQVRMALLEADVDFKVARSFVSKIRDEAQGEQVVKSLTPGQTVVKIVQDNLVEILGGDSAELQRGDTPPSVIMLVGLQGAGKTTAAAKLALHIRREWKQDVMLAACDLQRPAAVEQLVTLGKQIGAPVYNENPRKSTPLKVAKNAFDRAQRDQTHWLILDTAGRLAIDDELMSELEKIKSNLSPIETFLVVDAMTGQDAVNSGSEFNRRIGLTGMLLTKMDGDARGGAALSMKSVTGLPVKFVGVGERPEQLEAFHPERMAQRILGMGDVTTLIEKAQREIDEDEAKRFEQRLRRNEFDLNDMLEQFRSIRRMGPLSEVLGMIPGLGALRGSNSLQNVDERRMSQVEAIILSMTPQERTNPKIINGSRRRRVASGSGTSPSQVNQLLGQYRQMQKMMKRISGPGGERALQNMMRGMR